MTSGYLCILLFHILHPIYLSTCKIEIDEQRQWQATFRIFYDDLEDGIQNMQGSRPNLSPPYLNLHEDKIELYLKKHFGITYDGKSLPFLTESIQRIEDVIIIEVAGQVKWPEEKVVLRSDLLTEIFSQQKNIVQVHNDHTPVIYQSLTLTHVYAEIPAIN